MSYQGIAPIETIKSGNAEITVCANHFQEYCHYCGYDFTEMNEYERENAILESVNEKETNELFEPGDLRAGTKVKSPNRSEGKMPPSYLVGETEGLKFCDAYGDGEDVKCYVIELRNVLDANEKPAYLYFDGACKTNPGDIGGGAVIKRDGKVIWQGAKSFGEGTSNIAEYLALIAGMRKFLNMGVTSELVICGDSELIINQMSGKYKVKSPTMKMLKSVAVGLCRHDRIYKPTFQHIPRSENTKADAKANEGVKMLTTEEKLLIYYPNLSHTAGFKLDDRVYYATHDIKAMATSGIVMIDAAFLVKEAEHFAENILEMLDFPNHDIVVGKCGRLPVLGYYPDGFGLDICIEPSKPHISKYVFFKKVVVVLGLAVPVHLTFRTPEAEELLENAVITSGRDKSPTADKFPPEYRNHRQWVSNDIFVPYL